VSQTNRVVRHKTNARKDYQRQARRRVVVCYEDEPVKTYEGLTPREALVEHAKKLGYGREDCILVGNTMTCGRMRTWFSAVDVPPCS
jgi:hypothetical protein